MKVVFSFFTITLILISACTKVQNNGIPTYLNLVKPTIETTNPNQGSTEHSFSELWLEVDGNSIGAYKYPITFASLIKGKKDLVILPGIKFNAEQGDSRVYPIYEPFTFSYTFILNDTVKIEPIFKFRPGVTFLHNGDFESNNNFDNLDRTLIDDPVNISGKSGRLTLATSEKEKEAKTVNAIEISGGGRVFVEFSIKTEAYVEVGVRSSLNTTQYKSLAIFKPHNDWRTYYFEITSLVNKVKETKYNFYFNAQKGEKGNEEKVYIDNFKVIKF